MTLELVAEDPALDQEEVRELLFEFDGNVTKAAKQLHIRPERLRAYVRAIPSLTRAIEETVEQGVDQAIDVLWTALRDENSFQNRFYAAKEFLRSEAGRKRGFGPLERATAALEIKASSPSAITIKWIDPPKPEPFLDQPADLAPERLTTDQTRT
jgi:hypothetical protein